MLTYYKSPEDSGETNEEEFWLYSVVTDFLYVTSRYTKEDIFSVLTEKNIRQLKTFAKTLEI